MEQRLALGLVLYIGLSVYAAYYIRACIFEYYAAKANLSPRESYDLLHQIGNYFAGFVLMVYFDLLGSNNELRTMERLRNISVQHSRMGIIFFLLGPVLALILMTYAVLDAPSTSGYLILGYCTLLMLAVVGQGITFSRKLMMEYALVSRQK